jgi:hypothetical protein
MTITELKKLIDAAIERGINPDCTVVIDVSEVREDDVWEWPILGKVNDPTSDESYLWFTLVPSAVEADARFSPGHVNEDDVVLGKV